MPRFTVPDDDEFGQKYIKNHPENRIVFVLNGAQKPIKTVEGEELLYPTKFQLVLFPNGDVKGREL